MISVQSIDPFALPAVNLSERSQLPITSCIYFCLSSSNEVLYIGMTEQLKQRWRTHHRYKQLQAIGGVRIAYI